MSDSNSNRERHSQEGLDSFGVESENADRQPEIERRYPVGGDDGGSPYGMIGWDFARDEYVYTSPRKRADNYFRKIGGYPINVEILEKLATPPYRANFDPVKRVYIIQREADDTFPRKTVFEYDVATYFDADRLEYDGFGVQRCPKLVADARNIWKAAGDDIFVDGDL